MKLEMKLTEAPTQSEVLIRDLVGDEDYIARLRELGFTRGERIVLRGRTPFGDPLMVEIRGSIVALRKREAECIQI
jgi:Fe2+ transport system protein FeoA